MYVCVCVCVCVCVYVPEGLNLVVFIRNSKKFVLKRFIMLLLHVSEQWTFGWLCVCVCVCVCVRALVVCRCEPSDDSYRIFWLLATLTRVMRLKQWNPKGGERGRCRSATWDFSWAIRPASTAGWRPVASSSRDPRWKVSKYRCHFPTVQQTNCWFLMSLFNLVIKFDTHVKNLFPNINA